MGEGNWYKCSLCGELYKWNKGHSDVVCELNLQTQLIQRRQWLAEVEEAMQRFNDRRANKQEAIGMAQQETTP